MPKSRSRRYVSLPPIVYDPQSLDAQLATLIANQKQNRDEILKRLDSQDLSLAEIKIQTNKTNGRVSHLESWRENTKAKLAGMALVIGSVGGAIIWLVEILAK